MTTRDADLGTIQVVATAKDGNNPATTADSVGASVPVVVDAVLDRVATPDQASPASAAEQTTSQVVGLGLSLSFANTAYAAPSNQFYDGTAGDANETFAVKITVTGDAVNLQLDPVFAAANPGVTLTEGPAGTWTLNGTSQANVASAVAAVQAVVPANYDTAVTGSIEVVSTDTAPNPLEVDFSDNTQTKSDAWALNITPDVDPPTVEVTAGLTDGKLIVKEDGTASVSLQASVAAGTDDLLTKATITGLSSTAEYVINGTTVTGQTSYVLNFAGTNPSEAITIQVISQVDDADADLGTIQVVATAKDGDNAATTADSVPARRCLWWLTRFSTVLRRRTRRLLRARRSRRASQVVGLGLSLSFTNTAYAAPSNQFYDGTAGDANETFAVKITVAGDAVDLPLDPVFRRPIRA